MRYAIYGVNRVSKDFLYVFDELNVVMLFDDEIKETTFRGRKEVVYGIEDYAEKKDKIDRVIICDFYKELKKRTLENMGLIYGKDFCYEEDLFSTLDDEDINPKNKPLVVWGTGRWAEKWISWKKEFADKIEPEFYVDTDRNKNGDVFYGKTIRHPDEVSLQDYYIIVAIKDSDEVTDYLNKEGMIRWDDYCTSKQFNSLPSNMLRQTIFDKNIYDFRCETMLNHAEIGSRGEMICCCSTFIYHSLGNATSNNISGLWNSNIHKIMCLSNVNQTYSFCKKDMCPLFIGRNKVLQSDIEKPYKKMEKAPTTLALAHDTSCNLFCETCREKIRVEKGKELQESIRLSNVIARDLLPKCDFLIMAGDGEVFLSKAYREIYTSPEIKNLKYLRFLTNGILFNERVWANVRSCTNAKIMMTVSIDAATKQTYEIIRRGGNFDVLKKNMEYASRLRKKGELDYLRFNFVVQKRNYMEMKDFVLWALELEIDEVFFTKILNWGTYSQEEFRKVSMMQEDGITPKPELEEILKDSIMKNPIVDLGTIRAHNAGTKEHDFENYYRWELNRKNELFYKL